MEAEAAEGKGSEKVERGGGEGGRGVGEELESERQTQRGEGYRGGRRR